MKERLWWNGGVLIQKGIQGQSVSNAESSGTGMVNDGKEQLVRISRDIAWLPFATAE